MKVNPLIRNVIKEIADESVKYHNTPNLERKYLRRLLRATEEHLTEEEKLYLLKTMLEITHYKYIVTDANNILDIYNIKIKYILTIFICIAILLAGIATMFETNVYINKILDIINNAILLSKS